MKDKKLLTGFALAFILITTASCAMMQGLFEDKVVTTLDNVTVEGKAHVIPADLNLIPKDVRNQFEEAGKELVLVDKGYIKEPEKAIDVDDPDTAGWIDFGLGIAKTVFPGVAVLEGFALLFSQRKRKHYTKAVGQALPANGKIEIKDAVVSLARALGLAHSSEGTKKTYTDEVVKDKKA